MPRRLGTLPLRRLALDGTVTGAVDAWARAQPGSPYGDGYVEYRRSLERRLPALPSVLRDELSGFGARLGGAGALLVAGVPVPGDLPPTPTQPFTTIRVPVGTEAVLMAAALLAGEPVSFASWHGGDRLQNFYPLVSETAAQNSHNSTYLELHTETAFRPTTPDAVLLLCLRPDAGAGTLVCDLGHVCSGVPPATRAALARPGFAFRTPEGMTEPQAVVVTAPRPRFHYAEALVGVDGASRDALRVLRAAVERDCARVDLRRGDLLVVDNLHMIHGRTPFVPRYDGSDRWIQRCLVRTPAQVAP